MKKFTLYFTMGLLLALLGASQSQAQEADTPEMYLVMEEFVAPADMDAFWKAQTEAIELWDKLNIKMNYSAYRTDQNSFYWAMPINNFAGIDALFAQFMETHKAMIDAGWDPEQKFRDLSNISQFVVLRNKELSYQPEEKATTDERDIFYEWTFIYLKSGHQKEAAEAIKKYIDFTKEKGIAYYWDVYEVVFGNHTPCWILESSAKNEEDFRRMESDLNKQYKADYMQLWKNFVQHVRTFETTKGWYIPKWARNTEQ